MRSSRNKEKNWIPSEGKKKKKRRTGRPSGREDTTAGVMDTSPTFSN